MGFTFTILVKEFDNMKAFYNQLQNNLKDDLVVLENKTEEEIAELKAHVQTAEQHLEILVKKETDEIKKFSEEEMLKIVNYLGNFPWSSVRHILNEVITIQGEKVEDVVQQVEKEIQTTSTELNQSAQAVEQDLKSDLED